VGELVGRPERREDLIVPGGHATFGTGRSAFKHTLPSLAHWIGAHSDTTLDLEHAHGDQAHRVA
jgi:hypothetical protein